MSWLTVLRLLPLEGMIMVIAGVFGFAAGLGLHYVLIYLLKRFRLVSWITELAACVASYISMHWIGFVLYAGMGALAHWWVQ